MLRSIWTAPFPTHLNLFGRACLVALFLSASFCGTASAKKPTPTPTSSPTPIPTPTPAPIRTPTGGNKGWGVPTGDLTLTTVEPPTSGGVLQSASGYDYTVNAHATFVNGGKFDPLGTIGVTRYWQGIDSTGNYTNPTLVVNDGKWYPANSGFDKTKGRDYGPYTAGYPEDCTSTTPEVGGYGREILQLVYNDSNGAHVIATQVIQLYPNSPTQQNPPTAKYSNTLSPNGPVLTFTPNVSNPPVPVNVYQGDPPRITAQLAISILGARPG
jgi:hypothetical protein